MSGIHFSFDTSQFEDREQDLPDSEDSVAWSNGISGYKLAVWLGTQLKAAGFEVSDPWDEDHGWDFDITTDTSTYLCVCSLDNKDALPREAHVSLSKQRGLFDRLRGANKFDQAEAIVSATQATLAASSDIANLKFEIVR